MERLTLDNAIKYIKEVARKNRINKEKNTIIIPNSFISSNDCADKYGQVAKWLEELKSYKDLEEQGLLVRLPVAAGTNVYVVASFLNCTYDYEHCEATQKWKCEEDIQCEYEKKEYYVKEIKFNLTLNDAIGKTVFLTREEAEKKLEEMKNKI
nr:MAG TPA: hypothetical protein [Caudoviricetes sp.]